MQSGGGGGSGPGRVGPGGRAPSTSSAVASPSSSSSAVSTPQLGFESQQPQQQLGSRKAFQQQMHRKPEGNDNLLAYQAGGFQGIKGGNNYASSPGSVQMPQQSRKFFELAQQYANPSQDGQNRSPSVEQQVLNHQAYMQFAAAQQKSAAMQSQQQQAKMGMLGHGGSKDQETRMGNMKMQELMSMQVANQAQASSSKNSSEHFPRSDKHVEQGQQATPDLRNEQKPLGQLPVGGQLMPSNVNRPMQAPQPQANQNMGNNQLAMAQAMQAWALERNIDLSQPANANIVAQLIPLMQARMGLQQKANESGSGALSSLIPPPKQQATSPSIGSDNSQNANSIGDVSGQSGPAKAKQGIPPGYFISSLNPGVGNSTSNPSMQQFAFHNRETQVAPRSVAVPGNGMLPMHPPQSSASATQASNQSMPPKVVSSTSETTAVQHLTQLNRSPQSAGPSSSEASLSTVQMSQQRTVFTKQQLHVLKAQILAFRRLKKGESTLPQELLRAIAPPPLELQLQQQSTPAGTNISDRSSSKNVEDPARYSESKEKIPQMISSINGPTVTKQEIFVADEKPSVSAVHMQVSPAVIKDHMSSVNVGNDGQHIGAVSAKAEQEVEQSSQRTPVRNDVTADRGKAVAPQHASSDVTEAKKPTQANALSQLKDAGPPRKYHGPLFDFPFFTRKHDSVGSSATANNNNNFVLSYSVRDIVSEEGSEVFTKKRSENLKKINGLLAVNLERKRIRPDLVLRLQIEEKKLKLVDLQARLRDEVDCQQQEIMAMPDRPYRKFVRLCERQRMELSRQVQASQKALREKQWKSIFQWRKKLLEAHWAIRDARTSRNRGVAKYHERMLREFSKRKDDDRNKRMEALKNNDVERYREMLMEQQTSIQGDASERYAVLSSFLSQTEDYLHKLGSKITAAKNQQEVEEAADTAAAAARLQGLSEEEVKAAAACAGEEVMIRNRFMEMNAPKDGSSVNKYYTLAHAVNERVTRQPSMLRAGTLRDYQLVGLQWMLSLYNNKLNGILADEMGLGKTVQVMALIAYLMEFKGNYGPHLIIVPNAVLVNWKSEFHNWLPSCSCIFYVGAKEQRAKLFSQEVCAMKFNVLVTTYEFIMFDRSKLSKIDWKYIIIDEAQRMKDRESVLARDLDRYRCQRRLLLTGTPLQNDLKELWSLLNLLLPEVFDNRKAFHDWFSKPFQKEVPTDDGEDDWLETEKKVIIIHRLHQILEPFMLRRRVEDVEGSLPPKVSIVLKCRMSAIQSAIYDWIKSTGTIRVDPEEETLKLQRNPMYQAKIFKPLNNKCMELRKVCNHPLLSYPYFSDLSKDFLVKSCGKLWILDRILIKLHRTGHRVLLFSTMTKLLDILEEYLQWKRLVYRRIDGTTSLEDRESAIVDFNSRDSDCFIFLLSIRAAGRGLNLQTADTVIIYDPDPNPKNEEQAVARAHRIGQKREVKVIYMEAVVDKISSHQKEDEFRTDGTLDLEDDLAGKDRYVGSIESLIRNNIQQYKIDMADEVINAGRFDQRTTHEERRMTLETLLHDEERYQETVHDVPSLQQVNRMIARSKDEVELFDQMDEELDWAEEMTSFNQVPKWLRASTREVNSTIVSLSKKPSKHILFADGMDLGTNEVETERKRARPKAKKLPNYKEIDDEIGEYLETSSEERNGYSGMEDEGEIREFEDDGFSGAPEPPGVNKGQSEDDGSLFDGAYGHPQASQDNINKHEIDEAGSSGSSADSRRMATMVSPVSPQKFGSLSALEARPGSVSKKTPDELEEGEIAASGDSHMDHQQSGSWIHDRDEGEEEQVVQPKIRRKRSIRIRPRPNAEKLEEKSELQQGDLSPPPFQAEHKYQGRLRVNTETKVVKEQTASKQDNSYLSKVKRNTPLRRMTNTKVQASPKSMLSAPVEDHSERGEGWDGKAGSSIPSSKMSDVIQRRCKNVISKLQRRIVKEGQQIIPILTSLWSKTATSGSKRSVFNSLLDLRKIEQRVDRLEYTGVMELVLDVQEMLRGAMRFYTFSHEVRSEARKVHDLFFDTLKIAFPDTDFREARNAISFAPVLAPSRPAGVGQDKKHKSKDVDSNSSPIRKPTQPVPVSTPDDTRIRIQIPKKETRLGSAGSGNSNREPHQQDDSPLHPGELVICKKKRKDRDKSVGKARIGPSTPVSPPSASHNVSSPFSGSGSKDGRPSQQNTHQQSWGNQTTPVNVGNVGWANPVKRLRTDSGRRRPHP